jgi:hypothetical protein
MGYGIRPHRSGEILRPPPTSVAARPPACRPDTVNQGDPPPSLAARSPPPPLCPLLRAIVAAKRRGNSVAHSGILSHTQATSSRKDDTCTGVRRPEGIPGTWEDGQAGEGVGDELGPEVGAPPPPGVTFVDQDGDEPSPPPKESEWREKFKSTQSSKCKNDNMNLLPRRGVRPPLSAVEEAVTEEAGSEGATSGEAGGNSCCRKHVRVSRAMHIIVVTPTRSLL